MDCERYRDDRLDFLYGEADSATRERVLEHLAGCEACRDEVAGFRQLRQDLRAWKLPEGRGPTFVAPRRRAGFWLPLAAGFLLALGGGLLLQGTGRSDPGWQKAVADHEARILAQQAEYRREIDVLRSALASGPGRAGQTDTETETKTKTEAMLARVADMIRESEARQDQRLDAKLVQLDQKQESQRRYDMARIAAGLSYLDGKNGQHVARTTELMGYVLDAAAQQR